MADTKAAKAPAATNRPSRRRFAHIDSQLHIIPSQRKRSLTKRDAAALTETSVCQRAMRDEHFGVAQIRAIIQRAL